MFTRGPASSNPERATPAEVLRMQVNITFSNMFATDALRNHVNDFLVFTRPDSRDVNVVYRRRDGNFGLIQANGEMTTVAAPQTAGSAPAGGPSPLSVASAK